MWANEAEPNNANEEDLLQMRSFRFRIGVNNFNTANDLVKVTQLLREVAAKHPELNIVTYQHGRAIADQVTLAAVAFHAFHLQLNVLLPNTLQNDLLAMLCMVVISILCIPNPICTFWITMAMLSIELGISTGVFYFPINN